METVKDHEKVVAKVYGKDSCPYCDKVKTALAINGVPFIYIDVKADEKAMAFVKQEWTKRNTDPTVPLVVINDKVIGGYHDTVKHLSEELYNI